MSEEKKQLFLCDSFLALKPSESEQLRIAKLAENDALPGHIIKTYAPETRPFQEIFLKKEKIHGGYRPGTPAYNKIAAQRIIKYLNQPSTPNYRFFWDVYRYALLLYIEKEIPRLKSMLTDTPCSEVIRESKLLLKSICENSKEYDVTQKEIQSLYEAFWFERENDIEAILKFCEQNNEQAITNRRIKALADNFKQLENQNTEILNTTSTIESKIEKATASIFEQSKATNELKETLTNLEESYISINKSLAATTTSIQNEINRTSSAVISKIKSLETQLASKADNKDYKNEIKKLITEVNEANSRSQKLLIQTVDQKINETLETIKTSLENKISIGLKDIQKVKESRSSTAQQQSASMYAQISNPNEPKFKPQLTSEIDFVNSWRSLLNQSSHIGATFEQIMAHHSIISSSKAIVANEIDIVTTWLECTGWNSKAINLVASPIWASETDWKDGLNYLFQPSAESPRIVIIHNYDVAMTDCYLVPMLHLWELKQYDTKLSKLFLISSDASNYPSHQVTEHAPLISTKDFSEIRKLEFQSIRHPNELRGEIPCGIDPNRYKEFSNTTKDCNFDFQLIQNALGISFNKNILNTFEKLTKKSHSSFIESSAMGIGMRQLILPWVKSKYGESSYSALGEFLKQLPNVRL